MKLYVKLTISKHIFCSIPFSVDDISKSMEQIDISDIDPPPLIRENSGFSFLLPRPDWQFWLQNWSTGVLTHHHQDIKSHSGIYITECWIVDFGYLRNRSLYLTHDIHFLVVSKTDETKQIIPLRYYFFGVGVK